MNIDDDLVFLRSLRQLGILEEIETDRLPSLIRSGTQMVSCADSDQFYDIYHTHTHLSGCNRCAPLNHYGGALILPSYSPVSSLNQSDLVKEQLFLGYALGKGGVQVHCSHFPCGVARGYGLSAKDSLLLLCDARDEVLEFFQKRLQSIAAYLEVATRVNHKGSVPASERICLESKLSLRDVLAIERVIRCSSIKVLREIQMPADETILSHFHIDWGDRKRTYHLNRNMLRAWNEKRRTLQSAA